ncbi:MAG: 5-(carboxyamino)imidazole ribonucleotide synthase [Gemmatimonadota bacterium]
MRVGILGAGQLGRMLALAGYPLGARFRFFDAKPATAGHVAELVVGDYGDEGALDRFVDGLDVVTYEFENVPVEAARRLAERVPVRPPPRALEVAQDRWVEKQFFRGLGIDTAPFEPVDTREELDRAVEAIGLPAVLKTRRFGYDGKGQVVLGGEEDVARAWDALGGRPLILEGFVPFEREVSMIGVRGVEGDTAFYPVVENHHDDGILALSIAPAPDASPALREMAESCVGRVLDELEYVGVVAVEFFQHEGALLANELAPRVHNSGHWSIEGAEISQFENHMRAVLGLPLGSTAAVGHSVMRNVIGSAPPRETVLGVEHAHLHLYDKAPRPGRKLGHVTVRAEDRATVEASVQELRARIGDDTELA